jgi:membrane protease subunit (stomatin/prohibitin family)
MSFKSRSSKGNKYKKGNYGSSHYQKKGILGNLFNVFASRSGSGGHYNNNRNQHNDTSGQNQPLSNQGFLKCSKCSSQIPTGSKFCLECGERVKDALLCTNCGEKIPPNSKFCLKCGNKLNG